MNTYCQLNINYYGKDFFTCWLAQHLGISVWTLALIGLVVVALTMGTVLLIQRIRNAR